MFGGSIIQSGGQLSWRTTVCFRFSCQRDEGLFVCQRGAILDRDRFVRVSLKIWIRRFWKYESVLQRRFIWKKIWIMKNTKHLLGLDQYHPFFSAAPCFPHMNDVRVISITRSPETRFISLRTVETTWMRQNYSCRFRQHSRSYDRRAVSSSTGT